MTRAGVAAGLVVGFLVMTSGPAAAHVTVEGDVAPGGNGSFAFIVPNEREDASTVMLQVSIPEEAPLGSLRVQPKPGWTVTTTTRTLDEPVEVFGREVTEVIDTITWTADGPGIGPDEFDTFTVRGGPFPEDVDQVMFPAIQTYDSGEEVAWIEERVEGQDEPERPAPVLALAAGDDAAGAEPSDDAGDGAGEDEASAPAGGGDEAAAAAADEDDGDGLAVAGLVVGLVGLATAVVALTFARRRPASTA